MNAHPTMVKQLAGTANPVVTQIILWRGASIAADGYDNGRLYREHSFYDQMMERGGCVIASRHHPPEMEKRGPTGASHSTPFVALVPPHLRTK